MIEPIITSVLDTDHYKLTMGQFVFNRYKDVPVKYAYKNRTDIKLAEIINEKDLREELDSVRELKAKPEELDYLRTQKNNGKRLFNEDYLNFLASLRLPNYNLEKRDGQFKIEFPGKWSEAIYWETPSLAIKNELYYRALIKNFSKEELENLYNTGNQRLDYKLNIINENSGLKYIEFGTRRRFSKLWQDHVLKRMLEENPEQLVGTSNVFLAMKYGLKPSGTMAHELFMVMSGIMHKNDDEIRASHNQVLTEWWDEYGYDLSIALTDTYGSDFFFKDMTQKQAEDYKGCRQDSGVPKIFTDKQIRFYEEKNIDPRKKLFVPSDGLCVDKMVDLHNTYRGKILQVAGWGTNATNDLGIKALSQVTKATEANGYGTVKLSDNPAKATGSKEDIERFMKIFEYDPAKYKFERCTY
ncbi:Nicotinate phosphoribosyltransferase [uncultured archaeon]|nr:Nicotinate phosphoribosyltransferase [uncultured archaeon]